MSFLFASSHLPETRVQRPDELEDEEEDVQPMPRAGGVRAFSHLPAKRAAADPAGPLSQRGAQALGHQFQRTEPEGPATPPADGISAAKASGVFDVVRQQFNRDDSPHFMDEDGNLRPRDEARQQPPPSPRDPRSALGVAGAPPRPAWSTAHAADSSRSPRAASPASDDTRPWYMPPITPENLDSQHHDDDEATGSHSALNGRPELNDLVYRTPGASTPKPGLQDLLYRYNGSPEEARKHALSFTQNVADVYGSPPLLAAQGATLPQGESPRPAGNPAPPSSSQEKFQQAAPQTPAASPDKTIPQQPVQNVETPYEDLRGYLKKSKNPLFIKDFYDSRTPLEEKLRLRQLILSLRAPEGEKLPLYIQHLQHWFNAKNRPPVDSKEGPVTHPLKDLKQWPVVKEAYDKVLYRFGELPDGKLGKKTIFDWVRAHPDATKPGGVAVPDTRWDALVDGSHPDPVKKYFGHAKPGNEGYFYAFGRATITATSSGVRAIMDKNGGVRFRGTFNVRLHDRYDWNLDQGTPLRPDPKIPMEKIRQYIPKDIPVISPKGDEIQISDSFFKDLLEQGNGRDYDVEVPQEPVTLEFYQAKPGGPFQYKVVPRTP